MSSGSVWRRRLGVGARFLVVGALSTVIEVTALNLLVYLWGWEPVSAKVVASLVALVNAYLGNREWAFRGRSRRGRATEILLFLAVNVGCTLLGALLLWIGVTAVEAILERNAGPLALNAVNVVSIAIVVVVRFAFYHRVVFRPPSAGGFR